MLNAPEILLLTNFLVGYHRIMHHTLLQTKHTKRRTFIWNNFLKWSSFSTIYVCFKMTAFVQKGSDNVTFRPKHPWTSLLCYFPQKEKGWLRNGSPDFWSSAQTEWASATDERTGCTGSSGGALVTREHSVSWKTTYKEKSTLSFEMEYEVGDFLAENSSSNSNNNKNNSTPPENFV